MPMKREEKECSNCLYFFALSDDTGNCRKDKPAVFMDSECNTYTAFPTVAPYEWCGEGFWERLSDITGKVEQYGWDQESDISYWEDRILNKKEEADDTK